MSVLKYRKPGESTWHRMTNMVLKAFNIVQTKGNSQEDVMSQKAVTDELALKQDASGMTDYYTKDDLTGSSAVTVALADSATTAASADTALSLIASSAATATTNDYAILEDSNGNPIKIKTDSLIQALSNILYSNNKGTSVSDALVRGTDGEFGATTMSNLASVLGDKFYTDPTQVSNLDTIDVYNKVLFCVEPQNRPSEATTYGFCITFSSLASNNRNYRFQLYFDYNNGNFFIRGRKSDGIWASWKQL